MTLAVIEPHLTRARVEMHTFKCDDCGSIKSKIIELRLAA
jgi:hypothetical protein